MEKIGLFGGPNMMKKAIFTLLMGLTAPALAVSYEHKINNQTNAAVRVTAGAYMGTPATKVISSGQEDILKMSGWCTTKFTVIELDGVSRQVGPTVEESFKINQPKCESLTRTIDRDSTGKIRITTYRPLPKKTI